MFCRAEAEVALRPALDVADVGIGEFAPVAVAGAERERDLVADFQMLAVQLLVAHHHALEALRRGVEAERLLDRRRDQRGLFGEIRTLRLSIAMLKRDRKLMPSRPSAS